MPSVGYNARDYANPLIGRLWTHVISAVSGFDDRSFTGIPGTDSAWRWGHPTARGLRYSVYWGLYESTAYSMVHRWSRTMKIKRDLPESIREIASPAYRIGEFWATHIWGGRLDMDAGDGSKIPTALPIRTDRENAKQIRRSIAKIWKDSNWASTKDTVPRFGAVLGDVGIFVDDDPINKRVTLRPINPGTIVSAVRDSKGNVKSYELQEVVPDPRVHPNDTYFTKRSVVRGEICEKINSTTVRFQTFLDGEHFDWRMPREGEEEIYDWTEDYGFIPLVLIQNRDMGLGWGWSEFQSCMPKMLEMDSLATAGCDSIYKACSAPKMISGIRGPSDLLVDDPESTEEDPFPSKSRFAAVYTTNPEARASDLYGSTYASEIISTIESIEQRILSEHPELRADAGDRGASLSGEAIAKAREKVQREVESRRAAYDDGLARALAMALSIGGQKRYPGFESFSALSYGRGELEFQIGRRPVFAADTDQEMRLAASRSTVLQSLRGAGVPIVSAMKISGYSEDQIEMVKKDMEEAARIQQEQLIAQQVAQIQAKQQLDDELESQDDDNAQPTSSVKLDTGGEIVNKGTKGELNEAEKQIHKTISRSNLPSI